VSASRAGRPGDERAAEQDDDPRDAPGAAGAAEPLPRLTGLLLDGCERALANVLQLDGPADTALREFFRDEPRLGRRDRGTIADTVFDVLRHRRRYGHLAQSLRGPLPRRLMWLSFVLRHGEPAIEALDVQSADDRDALRRALAIDPASFPQPVRLSLPDWLHGALLAQAGGDADAVERLGLALLEPAPLDLRVNPLKADRDALLRALAAAGIAAEPLAEPQTAVRVPGRPALDRLPAFEQGWFEVQDAGSQRLVEFAAPRRGQTVVDFCAGAGGKTLALAAAMRSTGQVYACDVSAARLQRMKPRLARSGATSVQPFGIDSERDPKLRRLKGRADLVLVDAPCSGTGTLRRNPELKWRMQPEALEQLNAKQRAILAAASALVKRGGALVYATCSLVDRENEDVVADFGRTHPGFGAPVYLRIRPDIDGCDGFFAARWVRNA
jgi:16S rRNA (cytosine967-C5)-methyltransferase